MKWTPVILAFYALAYVCGTRGMMFAGIVLCIALSALRPKVNPGIRVFFAETAIILFYYLSLNGGNAGTPIMCAGLIGVLFSEACSYEEGDGYAKLFGILLCCASAFFLNPILKEDTSPMWFRLLHMALGMLLGFSLYAPTYYRRCAHPQYKEGV